ncbi:MAG: HAD-IIB family hydrolase [Clostridia bacterium]|nr:HAD-IIB family hydrolase [Clostridia bacterium]
MGKFSGILICADFDGTIALGGHVVEENIRAIRYFQENGGAFSVITGRTINFLRSRENEIICNACVGCVNGTLIYDYPNQKQISASIITEDLYEPLMKAHKYLNVPKHLDIFYLDDAEEISDADEDFEQQVRTALSKTVLKVLIRSSKPYKDEEIEYIKNVVGSSFETCRSWERAFEIQNKGSNKGQAAKKIAELCNASKLICVGDYENDLSMLEAADISYAVDNAIPLLKERADRITVNVEKGAIAAIIKDLESEL